MNKICRVLALGLVVLVSTVSATESARADSSVLDKLRFYDDDAHAGRVVYVDFWASWCVPCRSSFAWMNEMQSKYGEDGLVVVAVGVDREEQRAARFLDETDPGFEILFDPKGDLAREFDLEAMPSSFLYDREGKLRLTHVGFRKSDGKELEKAIVGLLREGSKAQ